MLILIQKTFSSNVFLLFLCLFFSTSSSIFAKSAKENIPLEPWEGDSEVEIYSAVLTALPCAARLEESGDISALSQCSPKEAATGGFALYDPAEEQTYLLKEGSVFIFQLEQGFGGSIDISGAIIGTRKGLPVISPEEYTIAPKPKASAFKGCL